MIPSILNGTFEIATRILYSPEGAVVAKMMHLKIQVPGQAPFEFELPPHTAHEMAEKIHQMAYQLDSDATLVESFHKLGVPYNVTNSATNLARLKRQAGTG